MAAPVMISSILPTSPKELSSCSSEQSVFLALLDYRRPLSAPPPLPRSVRTEPSTRAAPAGAAQLYFLLAALGRGGWVLVSAKAGAAVGLSQGWLALFSPKAAKTRLGRPNQQAVARPAGAKVFHCAAWLRNPAPRRPQLGPK